MRNGVILSGTLHTVVLALLLFGLPRLADRPINSVIPVEIVTLKEVDLSKPEPKPEPKPKPKAEEPAPKAEPPVQEAKAAPEPPPPPPPAPEPEKTPPVPEAKTEPEPPPPEPEPKPEPPAPEVKQEPPAPEPAPPPVPRRRPEVKMAAPEPPQKEPKKQPDRLASILRNVEQMKDEPQPRRKQAARAEEQGAPTSPPASAFERDEMIRQIQQKLRGCWRMDPGALKAQDLIIEIRVMLQPDGSVRRADILDVARLVQDAYFRSAAENARRAVFRCSPFKLPPRKYDVWRDLTLRFNPREMFGS